MRIAGGIAKGRRLAPPAIQGARPTSELIRGVIFNSLGPEILANAKVADLYAGIGSLGIESLSRGAAFADFVEKDPRQCAVLRRNLKATGLEDRAKVHRRETLKALTLLKGPYGVVLMDPPYRIESLDQDLEAIDKSEIIENEGMLIVGHSKRLSLKEEYGKLSRVRTRRHGDSVVDFFIRRGAQ